MTRELRSDDMNIYLVGSISHQILDKKLPSNRQVLSVLFYNIRKVKLTISESANLVSRECLKFWEKARIPTRALPHCVKKLIDLHSQWRSLQRNAQKSQDVFKYREKEFLEKLENLFDIAHANALDLMKNEEDKKFLLCQREPGRIGFLAGVDKELTAKEERVKERLGKEHNRLLKYQHQRTLSVIDIPCSVSLPGDTEEELSCLEETSDCGPSYTPSFKRSKKEEMPKRGRKNFMTPKLTAALDRCQLSARDAVFVIQATAEALGHDVDTLPINRSSIQRAREKLRNERAAQVKTIFQENLPPFVTVHWDGNLLPALNVRDSKEERLPIVVTHGDTEQLIGIPKLLNSSGKEQALAVWNTLKKWGLDTKVQFMCCDSTPSNTGRYNGATVLIEQFAERDILYFPCRHHIYELVLRAAFECKLSYTTSSPNITFFTQFREKWSSIDKDKINDGIVFLNEVCTQNEIKEMTQLFQKTLTEGCFRGDYCELLELCIIFLGKGLKYKLKLRPPGAMHHARWMAKAIYSLKMFLLRSELDLNRKDEEALKYLCIFIVTIYVKAWMNCHSAIKAPYQDLCFLKSLKKFETIDVSISQSTIKKLCNHLWYLAEEISILSLFDNDVDIPSKRRLVKNLRTESHQYEIQQKYYVHPDHMLTFLEKNIEDFVSKKSLNLFDRLQINTTFLMADPSSWNNNSSYVTAKKTLDSLKTVNDTAERAVKLMQEYHGKLTENDERKDFLLRCVHEHRRLYPDCKKETLKKSY